MAQSSEPSARDPQGANTARVANAADMFGLGAQVGAMALALTGHLALAGACLLPNSLDLRSKGQRPRLTSDPPQNRLRPFLDLGVTAALIAGQTLGTPHSAIHGAGPWSLAGFALLVAGARTLAPRASASCASSARALLATGLLLTPIAAALAHIPPYAWAITACSAWAAVHLLCQARTLLMHLDSEGVARGDRLILSGKGGATRNAMAALTATGVDFALFSLLVTASCSPPIATFLAAACGGVVNFTVNRTWTFDATGSNRTMARRYVLVSAASAALNASMVAALLWIPHQHVTICWLVARGLIFLGWNYPLHRDYVFAHGGRAVEQH